MSESENRARFGTITGVLVPNLLTILGLILFLRTGWVVGQAGLIHALYVVIIACVISLLTGLSLSSIATSLKVKAGGNYYVISRTLGLEVGGAVGIPLYLSQAISVAFYIIGFSEAFTAVYPHLQDRWVSTSVVLLFGFLAYIGADFVLKIQYAVLSLLALALVSFFTGSWDQGQAPIMASNYSDGVSFWIVFAVFFPAVTGIEVGTSMSGDLKKPERSIPLGTIGSIVISSAVYIAAVYWFATRSTSDNLVNNPLAMQEISRWPWLILAGVYAATLSSALGSILAAPRTLEALAMDRVVPGRLASRLGSPTEPRGAVLMTVMIALVVIWSGNLDVVAPVITMFFLNTYGMTNVVAALEIMVGNPSFRPKFKLHWIVPLLGAVGCYGAMFLIHPLATVFAIVISTGIFVGLSRTALKRTWGDLGSGVWYALTRRALLQLESKERHLKNWRPNMLVFTGHPYNREHLVQLSHWLGTAQGLSTFIQVLPGEVNTILEAGETKSAKKELTRYIRDAGLSVFSQGVAVPDYQSSIPTIVQAHGVGGLEPNTVLLGLSRDVNGLRNQLDMAKTLTLLDRSTILLNFDRERKWGQKKLIHVWWGGQGGNAELMLLLAHLISRHPDWEGSRIEILRIVSNCGTKDREDLAGLLQEVRVDAEPIFIERHDESVPFIDLIAEHGHNADLTFFGMVLPETESKLEDAERLMALTEAVGSAVAVRSTVDASVLSTG